jgi:hypothetical protein
MILETLRTNGDIFLRSNITFSSSLISRFVPSGYATHGVPRISIFDPATSPLLFACFRRFVELSLFIGITISGHPPSGLFRRCLNRPLLNNPGPVFIRL